MGIVQKERLHNIIEWNSYDLMINVDAVGEDQRWTKVLVLHD